MARSADNVLRSAGIVQSRLRFEETLACGFAYGLWWKNEPRPSEGIEKLEAFLLKIGLSFLQLRVALGDLERLAIVCDKLNKERAGLGNWFKLGLWVFANAWLLGSARYVNTTEAARELVREDSKVRAMGSNLIGALEDIGFSPEECEDFYVQKLVPFLYDEGHRKWVDNPSMAVMSDLRFKARSLDVELGKDSDGQRAKGAIRALISEIPVIGKSLEIVIFGAG